MLTSAGVSVYLGDGRYGEIPKSSLSPHQLNCMLLAESVRRGCGYLVTTLFYDEFHQVFSFSVTNALVSDIERYMDKAHGYEYQVWKITGKVKVVNVSGSGCAVHVDSKKGQ